MSTTSRMLVDEYPLLVYPTLAKAIGLNEALVLQQLHYWLDPRRGIGKEQDGRRWVYNTYEQWQEQFPFWSTRTIQNIMLGLEKAELIESTDRFNRDSRDRTKWYTINYGHPVLDGGHENSSRSMSTKNLDGHHEEFSSSSIEQRLRPETTADMFLAANGNSQNTHQFSGRQTKQITTRWVPSPETERWANAEGWTTDDLSREVERFRDHYIANGEHRANWDMTFKNWLRNPHTLARRGGGVAVTGTTTRPKPAYYKANGGLTPEGMAAKARGEI